jgi:osmotically-inducible protein OsmY
MTRNLCIVLVTLYASTWAQQQTQLPRYSTQSTFPHGQMPGQREPRTFPPDTTAPERQPMSTTEIQQRISDDLNNDPSLANTNVAATVDENSIVLTGIVSTPQQHDIAVHIALSHAGSRQIVDKIKIAG